MLPGCSGRRALERVSSMTIVAAQQNKFDAPAAETRIRIIRVADIACQVSRVGSLAWVAESEGCGLFACAVE